MHEMHENRLHPSPLTDLEMASQRYQWLNFVSAAAPFAEQAER
jgi:hypothetical protein